MQVETGLATIKFERLIPSFPFPIQPLKRMDGPCDRKNPAHARERRIDIASQVANKNSSLAPHARPAKTLLPRGNCSTYRRPRSPAASAPGPPLAISESLLPLGADPSTLEKRAEVTRGAGCVGTGCGRAGLSLFPDSRFFHPPGVDLIHEGTKGRLPFTRTIRDSNSGTSKTRINSLWQGI